MQEVNAANIKSIKDVAVVEFNTASICDIAAIDNISRQIKDYISQSQPKSMIFDFSQVKFFTSQTLGLLLDIWRKLQAGSGQVLISGINPQLHRVFKITNLDKIFKFYPDQQSALNSFGPDYSTRE
jgi:anti-sigma B factor antagonist